MRVELRKLVRLWWVEITLLGVIVVLGLAVLWARAVALQTTPLWYWTGHADGVIYEDASGELHSCLWGSEQTQVTRDDGVEFVHPEGTGPWAPVRDDEAVVAFLSVHYHAFAPWGDTPGALPTAFEEEASVFISRWYGEIVKGERRDAVMTIALPVVDAFWIEHLGMPALTGVIQAGGSRVTRLDASVLHNRLLLALELAVVAAVCWMAWLLLMAYRLRLRVAGGQCPMCGYDLRATAKRRCPECGRRISLWVWRLLRPGL